MKIVKVVLLALVGIVAVILIVATFLPAQYAVTRTTTIDKPQNEVFEYVANFHYWRRWNPWVEIEPDAEYQIEGKIRTTGASWSWKGSKIGSGKLTLDVVTPFSSITDQVEFFAPQVGSASDTWLFKPAEGGGTEIMWVNEGALEWPVARYVGLMLDSHILGPTMEKGLLNLKTLAENAHNLGPD